jgi:hypothetical protein
MLPPTRDRRRPVARAPSGAARPPGRVGATIAFTPLAAEVAMELTAVLTPAEEGGYIALNPETGTTTQGATVEEAVANLQEATALFLSKVCAGVVEAVIAAGHRALRPMRTEQRAAA